MLLERGRLSRCTANFAPKASGRRVMLLDSSRLRTIQRSRHDLRGAERALARPARRGATVWGNVEA